MTNETIANQLSLRHVAIIMDGNGRWASKRGLPRVSGHHEGAKALVRALKVFRKLGVHHLSVYAFSTENWKRPKEEVDGLMFLMERMIRDRLLGTLRKEKNFCVRFLGDKSVLPPTLREACLLAEAENPDGDFFLNIALNYGGRDEILHAVNTAISDGHTTLDAETLSSYLYTAHSPEPDLLIRTGGECRISNFLLWQLSYTEFIFTDVLWPDFDEEEINRCISEFANRRRRYGGLNTEKTV